MAKRVLAPERRQVRTVTFAVTAQLVLLAWFVLYLLNRRTQTGLLLGRLLLVLAACGVLAVASAGVELTYLAIPKKEQKLSKAGAAIYVITQEDIRRSGASTIPDVLRMVPGIDVAQIDANTSAISIGRMSVPPS